jgi:hypothetical protein
LPSSAELSGRVREYTDAYRACNRKSFDAFADLAALLLGITVGAENDSVRIWRGEGSTDRALLAPISGAVNPLRLRDGRYLRITINLAIVDTEKYGPRMEAPDCSFQYQADEDGDDWVFRYDYKRDPANDHPPAHLHVRGTLHSDVLGPRLLERVHFPVARPTLEGVIRLLAGQFGVPTREEPDVWRPVLHESERLFFDIAHRPTSGPPS